jgi:acyl homoserine lactone synthase
MLTTTLSFDNIHLHGPLFANMMRKRHALFIGHKGWDLPEAMGMEYDQYDTPASRWVVVHEADGTILAGNRFTPTTMRCGVYSYMIRDAQRGLLDSIPSHLLYDTAPVSPRILECSRLFVSPDVPSARRSEVYLHLVGHMAGSVRAIGATHCITLLASSWPRWAQRVGVHMEAAGPVVAIDGANHQVVFMGFPSLT